LRPAGAPLGRVEIDGCTLCLACASVCPTGAPPNDDPDRPKLRFVEDIALKDIRIFICVNDIGK
jgi:ferredoxin